MIPANDSAILILEPAVFMGLLLVRYVGKDAIISGPQRSSIDRRFGRCKACWGPLWWGLWRLLAANLRAHGTGAHPSAIFNRAGLNGADRKRADRRVCLGFVWLLAIASRLQ